MTDTTNTPAAAPVVPDVHDTVTFSTQGRSPEPIIRTGKVVEVVPAGEGRGRALRLKIEAEGRSFIIRLGQIVEHVIANL